MKIPQHIWHIVESLRCPKHHKSPVIVTEEDGDMSIDCCCADFKKQCLYLVSKFVVTRQKRQAD